MKLGLIFGMLLGVTPWIMGADATGGNPNVTIDPVPTIVDEEEGDPNLPHARDHLIMGLLNLNGVDPEYTGPPLNDANIERVLKNIEATSKGVISEVEGGFHDVIIAGDISDKGAEAIAQFLHPLPELQEVHIQGNFTEVGMLSILAALAGKDTILKINISSKNVDMDKPSPEESGKVWEVTVAMLRAIPSVEEIMFDVKIAGVDPVENGEIPSDLEALQNHDFSIALVELAKELDQKRLNNEDFINCAVVVNEVGLTSAGNNILNRYRRLSSR